MSARQRWIVVLVIALFWAAVFFAVRSRRESESAAPAVGSSKPAASTSRAGSASEPPKLDRPKGGGERQDRAPAVGEKPAAGAAADSFDFVGRVLSFDAQKGIAGANVSAHYPNGGSLIESTTDDEGRYTLAIHGALPAHVDLVVTAEGWSSVIRRDELTEGLERTRSLDFTLRRGFTVTGRVRATGDGAAIAGAEVQIVSRLAAFQEGWQDDTTDEQGEFRVDAVCDVPRDAFDVLVTAEGFAPVRVRDQAVAAGRDLLELEVNLPSELRVHGRVIDAASGAPIAGATVESFSLDRSFSDGGDTATTAANGEFEVVVAGIPPSDSGLVARAAGHRAKFLDHVDRLAEGLSIALEAPARLTGRVVDHATQEPIAHADVRVNGAALEPELADDFADAIVTRADGTFELALETAPIDRGARVVVDCDGYSSSQRALSTAELATGAPLALELERAVKLRVHVSGALDRAAVHGATISVLTADRNLAPRRAETDEHGDAELWLSPSRLRSARVAIEFLGRRFPFAPIEWPAEPPVEISREYVIDAPPPHDEPTLPPDESEGGAQKH